MPRWIIKLIALVVGTRAWHWFGYEQAGWYVFTQERDDEKALDEIYSGEIVPSVYSRISGPHPDADKLPISEEMRRGLVYWQVRFFVENPPAAI